MDGRMRKRGTMQRKLEELEYESAHRGGNFSRIQKSLRELDQMLKSAELGKKKK